MSFDEINAASPGDAALLYGTRWGLRIHPLHSVDENGVCSCGRCSPQSTSRGKHPRLSGWKDSASRDAEQIRAWWGEWPTANVGLALTPEAGIVVLDIDGEGPRRLLEELELDHGLLPGTAIVRSGRPDGGQHIYLRVPPGTRLKSELRVDGHSARIEVKTASNVVLPPSRHYSGARYQWAKHCSVADAPDWLLTLLVKPTPSGHVSTRGDHRPPEDDALVERAATVLRAAWPTEGLGYHGAVLALAGALLTAGWTEDEGLSFIRRAAPGRASGRVGELAEAIRHTAAKCATKEVVTGWPSLAEAVGSDAVSEARRLLGFWQEPEQPPAPTDGDAPTWCDDDPDGDSDGDSWPELCNLPERSPVPTMTPDMVPEALRAWTSDVAEQMCVPLEMVAVPAVIAASSLLGSSIPIWPEGNSEYDVRANLWGVIIGDPGGFKSPALRAAIKPLRHIAVRHHEEYQREKNESETERKILTARLKNSELRKADPDIEEVKRLESRLKELNVTQKRHLVEDVTPEKLAMLMLENQRGLMLCSDELASLFASFKKAGYETARSLYLKAWNGCDSHSVDRMERGSIYIPKTCLSIAGTTQPAKFNKIIRSAIGQSSAPDEADGLLQRFQLIVWPDKRPHFADRVKSTPSKQAYRRALEAFEDIEERCREESEAPCRFDDAAQAAFDSWRLDYEKRLEAPELRSTPAWAGFLEKHRSLVPSLAAVFHFLSGFGCERRIELDSLELALRWLAFIEGHQRKVYDEELNPGRIAAEGLARRLKEGQWGHGDTASSLRAFRWPGLSTADEVTAGLHVLEAAHWVRVARVHEGRRGRPSNIVLLHPQLRGELCE